MASADELVEMFRARGLKITPQRLAVFRALEGDVTHPTAEVVHERVAAVMPTVSLRTVYQTLHDLAAMGAIGELELGTGSVRFDPNTAGHHHLVCDGCGRVHDVDAAVADAADLRIPRRAARGFQVSRTEVVFRGLCPECAAAPAG